MLTISTSPTGTYISGQYKIKRVFCKKKIKNIKIRLLNQNFWDDSFWCSTIVEPKLSNKLTSCFTIV